MNIWTNEEEATRLKTRFLKVNRAEFARNCGLKGGQALIYQHINGLRPISLDAALAYARGFSCNLEEISPRIAIEVTGAAEKTGMAPENSGSSVVSLKDYKSKSQEVEIPQFDTGGAMGTGILLRDQPGVIQGWKVTPEWIEKNVKSHSGIGNLAIVTGFGDSMRGMFNPGDPLLVDRGITNVEFDGVYFFRVGEEGFIKRLQRVPGEGLIAISENKSYKEWIVKPEMDFEVFARVVKVWCGTEF